MSEASALEPIYTDAHRVQFDLQGSIQLILVDGHRV